MASRPGERGGGERPEHFLCNPLAGRDMTIASSSMVRATRIGFPRLCTEWRFARPQRPDLDESRSCRRGRRRCRDRSGEVEAHMEMANTGRVTPDAARPHVHRHSRATAPHCELRGLKFAAPSMRSRVGSSEAGTQHLYGFPRRFRGWNRRGVGLSCAPCCAALSLKNNSNQRICGPRNRRKRHRR